MLFRPLACFLTTAFGLAAQAPLQESPHVFWKGQQAEVCSIEDGQPKVEILKAPWKLRLPGLPLLTLDPKGSKPASTQHFKAGRLLALSDIHGNYAGLVKLLRAHKVVNEKLRWTFGKGHLVVVGDVADRGAGVTEAYWLIRSLEAQAAKQGGRVHQLLGNHEAMLMAGDFRYVHPKYNEAAALLGRSVSDFTSPDSELGRWLRTRSALLKVNGVLFIHAGISPEVLALGKDLEALNGACASELGGPKGTPMLGGKGLVWYRGLIPGVSKPGDADATPEHVEAVLKAFGVKTVVVGHSTLPEVTAFHGGKVIGVDAGLKDGKEGEVLIMEKGRFWRGFSDGTRVPLDTTPLRKAAGL